jgi:hypothetical protein
LPSQAILSSDLPPTITNNFPPITMNTNLPIGDILEFSLVVKLGAKTESVDQSKFLNKVSFSSFYTLSIYVILTITL